jgi:hypothetical protein
VEVGGGGAGRGLGVVGRRAVRAGGCQGVQIRSGGGHAGHGGADPSRVRERGRGVQHFFG